ncbi:MAG: hypothetical protein MJ192_04390 [Clostridia bacterium]|nr:hypothetical protein [Clostridia bacterium]
MKKIIALAIAALMILSMIPVVTLSASAAGEGEWITKRAPKQSDEELEEGDTYKPAPGYHYDSEGFHTDSPNYDGITPMFYVRTRDSYNLQDGFHLEFRVDEFAYKGVDPETGASLGKDEWLCVSLFPGENMEPGSTEYGSGWLCLIRGEGNGSAVAQPHWTDGRDEEGNGGGFGAAGGFPNITVPLDEEDKEIYTVDVNWNGTSYEILVNGASLAGGDKLAGVIPDGNCYVSIIGQTQLAGGSAAITILDWNGAVPTGTDSKEPDENVNVIADITPSDTIPEGQPAFIWDASCQVMKKLPTSGQMCNITPKGDNTVHITATGSQLYFSAGPSNWYSYEAADFPVLTMMLRNYNGEDGQYWYAAGDIMGAQDDAVVGWSLWDEDYADEYEVNGDLYNLVCVDMRDYDPERWVGIIHGQRLVFNGLVPDDEEFGEFDLCWFACFRTVEDAKAYGANYVSQFGTPETDAPTEAPTEKPTEAPTDAPETTADDTGAADTADGTGAETGAGDEGCKSVIGGCAALILTAAAAAVALKRKH